MFSRACELLLSNNLERPLDAEEQGFIRYYVSELYERFGHDAQNGTHVNPSKFPEGYEESRTKMHTNRLRLEQGVLNAVMSGEFELGIAQTQFVELLDEAVKTGAAKVLIDGHQLTGNPREFERFLYGEFVAWATVDIMRQYNIRLRFAYVIREPLRDPERFGETIAVNRGMDVKTFEDMNEAMQWLNQP